MPEIEQGYFWVVIIKDHNDRILEWASSRLKIIEIGQEILEN